MGWSDKDVQDCLGFLWNIMLLLVLIIAQALVIFLYQCGVNDVAG